jgi:chromosomal replication initiation ATPase DnaA
MSSRLAFGPGRLVLGREQARFFAEQIAPAHGVTTDEIFSGRRFASIAAARRELYVALFRDGFSISEVGTILGKDHTTVIHGMRKKMGDDVYDREIRERYPNGWLHLAKGGR